MPGGLFFPPTGVRVSTAQENTVEYYKALAAVLPFAIMTVLIVICFVCAECFGKRKRKAKEREPRRPRIRRDPSKPFSAKEELAREPLLRTPTGSPETPPSIDYMNMSFGYGNSSMIGEVRSDLEGTYKAVVESPVLTTTPPFARLRPTPPGLFKKEEDKPQNLQNQPEESRSPSPTTLIRQGKQMRYGAWIRADSSTSSSTVTSDSSQSMFHMSIGDDEAKRAKEEEKKAKERKKVLREKKRLKKEMREDQAAIIRQQITWTVKDEIDQMKRESRAIDIPPRKRIEEHPQYQKMVIAMVDENNVEFEASTVLNSAWEKGRMEEFLRENLGYVPGQMGAMGGETVEDFSTLRYVKEEEPGVDDTQQLLPEPEKKRKGEASQHHGARRKKSRETGAKGKSAEDLSEYYVKKVVPVTEAEEEASQHGARRKVPLETGTKGKSAEDLSQYYVKKVVPVTEAEEASRHGARRKVPLETGGKGKAAEDLSQYYVKKVVPVTEAEGEASQQGARRKVPLETGGKGKDAPDSSQQYARKVDPVTEGEAPQHQVVRWKSPLETVFTIEPCQPQIQQDTKKKASQKTSSKGKAAAKVADDSQPINLQQSAAMKILQAAAVADDSQPLLLQHVGRKILSETEGESDDFQPAIHLPVSRVAKGVSLQPLFHLHSAGGKVHEAQMEGGKKLQQSVDNSQPLFHHYGAGKNYGTMLPEVRPIGVFTKKMMDKRVPLVIGREFEEKSSSETRKVSTKIAKAVFDIEMKRIEDQMIESYLKTTKKDGEQYVEIHQEPSSSGLISRKPIAEVEIHQEPSSSGLIRRIPIAEVEIHQEPSSSGLIRRKPIAEVEIHQEPQSSGLIRRKPIAEVEIHQDPSSSGLIRRKQSPAVDESEHVVEIHQEPSSSELIRRKSSPVVEEDTVVELEDEDTSSSWEDIVPMQKHVWWAGIRDRKKKGDKKKKYGRK